MYTLIHFKRTQIRGKYNELEICKYANKWIAYRDAREVFDKTTDPTYAGFMIKDKDGNTLVRQKRVSAI